MPEKAEPGSHLAHRVQELEAALAASAARERDLRTLVENSQDILYRTDADGLITYVSPSVTRLSGYTVEEAVGLHMANEVYVRPEERNALIGELRKNGEVRNFLAQLKRKDGSLWWASTNAHLCRDDSGAITGVEGIARDVTEMIEANLELERIFTMSLDLICIADLASAAFTKVNPAFTATLGYAEDELLGRPFLDFVHPDDVADTVAVLESKLKAGQKVVRFLNRYRCRNGSYRWLSWVSHPLPETGETYAVAHDVTDEILVAEAQRESERKFRNIVESSPMGIHLYELDRDDRLIFTGANPAADRILGITHSAMVGLTIEAAFPALQATEIPDSYRTICSRGTIWQTEQVVYKDERISGAYEVYAFQTSPGRMAVFFVDITERKLAEEERSQLQEQLTQARKMEAIGTLAGGIAHDFNNILMGIQGRVSLALMELVPGTDAVEHLTGIEEYIRGAADLTKQLLGFARGGKYEIKTIAINELVDKSAAMFARTRKTIRIHQSFDSGLWNVDGDAQQLHQVLLNLYVNAWQAMPHGGEIFLETSNIEPGDPLLAPLSDADGCYVRISVIDTGTGMDEATRQKIFEPFFTTREKSRGTGLGLASAYGIVKNHGGFISVDSTPGQGSSFGIYLPATTRAVEAPPPATNHGIHPGTGTILLVDDEAIVLEVATKMLQSLGYTVTGVAGGKEAVAHFSAHHGNIDLVVLDMIMPVMDGGTTFELLRRIDGGLRVLLASGYSMDGRAANIISDGRHGFIQKPFSLEELSVKIRDILTR